MKQTVIKTLGFAATILCSAIASSQSYACVADKFVRWCPPGQQVQDAARCVERVSSTDYFDYFNRCSRDVSFAWCWDHNSLGALNLCPSGKKRPTLVCNLPQGENAVFINEDEITYWVWYCS